MGNPFAHLDRLRAGAERHEVTLDDVFRIGCVEPQRLRGWEVVRGQSLVGGHHSATSLVRAGGAGLRKCVLRGRGARWLRGRRLAPLGEVERVAAFR